jgi:hypothetical protein
VKLPDFLPDTGRPIAYFPALRRIAGSTNATLLLCQLIYWSGKEASGDGWIFKRARRVPSDPAGAADASDQSIEFETGLSYKEQRVARKLLRERGLVRERHARREHFLYFQVDFEALQRAWVNAGEQLPDGHMAVAQSAPGNCPTGTSLNSNYTDYAKTTSERPTAARNGPEADREQIPATPLEALEHPMIQLFQQICGRMPGTRDYAVVIGLMRHFHQLHNARAPDFLRPFWLAWSSRKRSSDGRPYDPGSLTWLSEWAMNNYVPPNQGDSNVDARNASAIDARRGPTAPQELSEADQAAARRINDRRKRPSVRALQGSETLSL